MKALFLALIFSGAAHALEIDLNQEAISVGKLPADQRGLAFHRVQLKRTAQTPDHVTLAVSFDQEVLYCSKYQTTRVWIPGDFAPDCNERRCYPAGRPGFYTTEKVCVEHASTSHTVEQQVRLDFDHAATLAGDQVELFSMTVKQQDKMSSDLLLEATVVKAENAYAISQKKNKAKLRFEQLD